MRKLLITVSSLVVVVLLCVGAASIDYNTYMNNVVVYTNVMARTATITNGITAGASTFTGTLTALPSVANTQPLIVRGGTVTADTPIVELSETWNNAGVTFIAIKANITNTASAAASLLMDLQADAASKFKVQKDGATTIGPSVTFSGTAKIRDSGGIPIIAPAGTDGYEFAATGLSLTFAKYLAWSSGSGFTPDTYLYRDAANTLQLGADAASPSAQTFKAADGSGTDKTGASFTLEGGQGTGTGTGGSVIIRTGKTGASTGSSANAYDDRARYPAKYITLTDNTIASLFTVTLPATNSVGISWTCTIMAGDATDSQSLTTTGTIDGVAKSTTITAVGTPTAAQTALAGSAGTLSVTYTFVDLGSNVMALRVTADTSLTPTYLRAKLELTGINIHGAGVVINEL